MKLGCLPTTQGAQSATSARLSTSTAPGDRDGVPTVPHIPAARAAAPNCPCCVPEDAAELSKGSVPSSAGPVGPAGGWGLGLLPWLPTELRHLLRLSHPGTADIPEIRASKGVILRSQKTPFEVTVTLFISFLPSW